MHVSWDFRKAHLNWEKHGVSFEEAATVILAPMTVTIEDSSSKGEQRLVTIGISVRVRVIIVVYSYREEDEIRIISARKATKKEQDFYEKRVRL